MRRIRLALIATLLFAGCSGPPLQVVKGNVSLDGKPLPNAAVMFQSEDESTYAMADTNENGDFELLQDETTAGLPAGKYLVTISTFVPPNEDADPPDPGKPELVPERYNVNSELFRDVTAGANAFDFKLESGQ